MSNWTSSFWLQFLSLEIFRTKEIILLLGEPGVGKTTAIREIARVLSDGMQKRVIIIDTSNEIAGDGDLPHPFYWRKSNASFKAIKINMKL